MVMLAVLKGLLYRSSGSDDIVVGSPLAGRVRTELQSQIGPYLNVVALRTAVAGSDPFDVLLDRIRETVRSKLMRTSFIRSIGLWSNWA
jgi:non-ribosomal peptide synthetase component F